MTKYRIVEHKDVFTKHYTVEFKFLGMWLFLKHDYGDWFPSLERAKEFLEEYITSGKKVVFETSEINNK